MKSRSKAHRPIRLGTGTATGVPQKFPSKQRISPRPEAISAKHSIFDMTMPATLSQQRPTTTIEYREGHRTSHLVQIKSSQVTSPRSSPSRAILSRHITSHHIALNSSREGTGTGTPPKLPYPTERPTQVKPSQHCPIRRLKREKQKDTLSFLPSDRELVRSRDRRSGPTKNDAVQRRAVLTSQTSRVPSKHPRHPT